MNPLRTIVLAAGTMAAFASQTPAQIVSESVDLSALQKIRDELGSDKVFDVVGRLFQNVRIADD